MTYLSRVLMRVVFAALALASLSAAACDLPRSCNCPNGGGFATVAVPAAQSSPIASVSAEGQTCTASSDSTGNVDVSSASVGTCAVLVHLANGDSYAFSVVFQAMTIHGACDCTVLRTESTTAPELVATGDGGSD